MARERRGAGYGALLLALVSVGCDGDPPAPPDTATEWGAASLDVMWSGCVLLDEGRGCQRTRWPLRVWVSEYDATHRWTISGVPVQPRVERADGGTRFGFDDARFEGGELVLSAGGRSEPLVALDLVPDDMALPNFAFGETVTKRSRGDAPSRRAAAQALLKGSSTSALERLARVSHARRLSYDKSDAATSAAVMLPLLEEEERLAAAQGRWAERCESALVGLHWASMLERPELRRRWGPLEDACRERGDWLAARFDYYLGESALVEGKYAEGEARLAHHRRVIERLLPEDSYRASLKMLPVFARTGRWSEAKREMDALEAMSLTACERARLWSTTAFVRLRALQTAEADLGDPGPELALALEAHTRGACKSAPLRVHDLAKMGFDAVVHRDAEALRLAVERLDGEAVYGKYAQQAAELRLALAVLEERFDEVPELAARMASRMDRGEPEARWRHHMLMAEVATTRRDRAAAEAAYRSAERVLDRVWEGVDSGAVRARWLAAYRQSALGLMQLHLEAGELEEAACAARSARLRALELPVAAEAGDGRCDRLWSRNPDELVFLIVPETDENWHVFVVDGERVVEASRVVAPTAASATSGWWDRWSSHLETAKHVRILASGAALRPALHGLGWGARPLAAQRPVTFGLDLAPSAQVVDVSGATATASVVFSDADPLRTLDRYADQVRTGTSVLEGRGWSVDWTDTPDTPAMAKASDAYDVLIYYGHGQRVGVARGAELNAADDVGSTALLLRGGELWGAEEVAALDRPPRRAILLGCEIGFSDVQSWSGGLNLAHALLLAGAEEVLAASAPLDAATAAEASGSLFAGARPQTFALSSALHRAWASAPSPDPEDRWETLRVWSR